MPKIMVFQRASAYVAISLPEYDIYFMAPMNKSILSQAYRRVRDRGNFSTACRGTSRKVNKDIGLACKPLRARPLGHLFGVDFFVKD